MQHLKWISLAIVFGFTLMACNKNADDFSLGKSFELDFKQCVKGMEENVEICFEKIVSESRCPCDSECVWAGELVVELSVSIASETNPVQLSSIFKAGQRITLGDYAFTLKGISPDCPKGNGKTKDKDYTIELLVETE